MFRLSVFFILFFVTNLEAQKFSSAEISANFHLLPDTNQDELIKQQNTTLTLQGQNYVIYSKTEDSIITHIGIRLPELEILPPDVNLLLERLFLKILLEESEYLKKYLVSESIHFYCNNLKGNSSGSNNTFLAKYISDSINCNFLLSNQLYEVTFSNSEGDTLLIEFPSNVFLMSGMDAKELDDFMNLKLKKIAESQFKSGDSIFIHEPDTMGSNFFLMPEFSSRIYISTTDNKPVYDPILALETFSNMFLFAEENAQDHSLHLTHKSYGDNETEFNLSLLNTITEFSKENQLFFSIADTSLSHLHGMVIIYNDDYNYYHFMDIRTDFSTLFGCDKPIETSFYSYIPLHGKTYLTDHLPYKLAREIDKLIERIESKNGLE